MLTELEKRQLIYFTAAQLNCTIAIACNELRKAIDKLVGEK